MRRLWSILQVTCIFVERLGAVLARSSVVLVMCLVVVNAVMRHVVNDPIDGTFGVVELYLMPAIVFLGLAEVQRGNKHIAVELVTAMIGIRAQNYLALLNLALQIAVVSLMLFGAYKETLYYWGQSTMGVPKFYLGPSWLLVSIGLSALWFRLILDIVGKARNIHESHPKKGTQS